MGREKERMLEAQFSPYRTEDDRYVCADCFLDPYIKDFISNHEEQVTCDYCDPDKDEEDCRAAPANVVLEYIEECVLKKYTDAENIRHSLDPRGMDAEELALELDVLSDVDGNFREELELLFGRDDGKEWLAEQFYDDNSTRDVFVKSWAQFKKLVMYKSRYVFSQIQRDTTGMDHWEEQIDPHSILQWIHGMVSEFDLITTLPEETVLYRVRADSEQYFTTLDELGTAPIKFAKYASRMNPVGIPMFYASDHVQTAIREVWNGTGGIKFSVGKFRTMRACQILDLCQLPPVPSIFKQSVAADQIDALSFLRDFKRDISQPVTKTETEHIDYVPTQILTEYFRHIYRTPDGNSIMGVKYTSSRTGKPCYVMFWGHEADEFYNPNLLRSWCSEPVVEKRGPDF